MTLRQFMKYVALGVLLLSSTTRIVAETNKERGPNIILIMTDDLGWKELGCYGQEKIKTPHIDRIANDGMKFMQFYSGSAVCAPSRCNLMTGMHGGHAYIRNNGEIKSNKKDRFGGQTPLPQTVPSIAKILKKSGYVTGCFGKWGLGGQGTSGDPLRQGFDQFYGYNCQRNAHNLYPKYLEDNDGIHELKGNNRTRTGKEYAPQLIADKVMEFVKQNSDKPFFLYYPTVIPHLALQVPENDMAQYKGKWQETPYKAGSYQSHDTPKACYAGMISFMDGQVGRLMALLKDLEIDENTVVIFTSDNGTSHLKEQVDYEFFNSVGALRGLKGSLYEGGIRVPMIVRWPKHIKPGTSSDLIAAHYDLPVTLSEIAGVAYDEDTDGISMLPTYLGKDDKQKKHDFLFWDFAGYGGQIAVRMGEWKGIKRNMQKNPNAPLELYNLDNDIGEKNNLAEAHPKVVKQIESIILQERTVPTLKRFRFGQYQDETEQLENGWTSLFDGETLNGWEVKCLEQDKDKRYWKVEEGSITAETPAGSRHKYIWLMTNEEYDDFELKLKVQTYAEGKGNSGIQVRSRYDDAAGWLDGPQVDIHPPGPWRNGFIYDETRGVSKWISPIVGPPRMAKPEHAPKGWKWSHADKEDVWNDVHIICRGSNIKTVMNGVTIVDYNGTGILDDEVHLKHNAGMKGHICLQIHPGGPMTIRFKDIRLKRL